MNFQMGFFKQSAKYIGIFYTALILIKENNIVKKIKK